MTFVVQWVIWGKVQYWIWNPQRISKSMKKNYSYQSIDKEIRKLYFCGPESLLRKVQYRIWNPHQISKSKKKKNYSNQSRKNEIMLPKNVKIVMFKWTFVVLTVIWGKYNIGFGIPIKFTSQRRRKIIKIGQETSKLCFN